MGLSNSERYQKLVYTTNALTQKGREVEKKKPFLNSIIEKLWPALLRQERNTTFWILGGSTGKDTVSSSSLFGIALLHAAPQETPDWEPNDEFPAWALDSLSINRLLHEQNPTLAKVFDIFELTEAATYPLRRYDDEMAEQLREYDNLICRIQGECFRILLSEGELLLYAWLQEKIIGKLLTYEEDVVNTWWKKQCIHHNMRLLERPFQLPLARMVEIFKKIQFEKPSINERVLLTIEIAGPRWHYAHQHKDALALFEAHNKETKEEKIDIQAVKEASAKCAERYETRQKESADNYRSRIWCELTEQSDKPKKETPAKPKTKRPKANPQEK